MEGQVSNYMNLVCSVTQCIDDLIPDLTVTPKLLHIRWQVTLSGETSKFSLMILCI